MRILLSNDDGYRAPGLVVLHGALRTLGSVTVVAPDRDRSGASNSLTLTRPLRASPREDGVIAVDGTPTDCVHLALTGLVSEEPDIVVAGINAGGNLGDDVLYSGTVAAAIEGRHLGLPAIAVSLVGAEPTHFDTAAGIVVRLLRASAAWKMPRATILNVNVPDMRIEAVRGFQATRLGNRHKAEPVIRAIDPRGGEIFWVGSAGPEQDAGPGTDFHAVRNGFVSVTPLQIDLTRYAVRDEMATWLEKLGTQAEQRSP